MLSELLTTQTITSERRSIRFDYYTTGVECTLIFPDAATGLPRELKQPLGTRSTQRELFDGLMASAIINKSEKVRILHILIFTPGGALR